MMDCVVRATLALMLAIIVAPAGLAQSLLTNGSFEDGLTGWTVNPSYNVQVVSSGWNGISAADGDKFLAVSGPVNVSYIYIDLVWQTKSAPFGPGIPSDSIIVYLFAKTYLHTADGRNVSYALMLEPGYGDAIPAFHGLARDRWVDSMSSGYYIAQDTTETGSPSKPIKVRLELREPLAGGEYLLLDLVDLQYGGQGV